MTTEAQGLYQRLRPKLFKGLVGQPEARSILTGFLKNNNIPHALLLHGPSGTGKTTSVRILKDKLGVSDSDYQEVDATNLRGVDTIRDIRSKRAYNAIGGRARMWCFDEAHQLTKDAQNALLKILEDNMPHVYLILATTEPEKILPTVRTRLTSIPFKSVGRKDMLTLITGVCVREKKKQLDPEVAEKIIEVSNGSPRAALVNLEKVFAIKKKSKQINAIEPVGATAEAMDIVRALMPWKGKAQWSEVAAAIKKTTEDPEKLRRIILSCAGNDVLAGSYRAARAAVIIQAFRDNFYDCGKSGLIGACWDVFHTK